MQDKIFITLTLITPKTAELQEWEFTDTSSLAASGKLKVLLEFIEAYKKAHNLK
jgi:hypothetical protein